MENLFAFVSIAALILAIVAINKAAQLQKRLDRLIQATMERKAQVVAQQQVETTSSPVDPSEPTEDFEASEIAPTDPETQLVPVDAEAQPTESPKEVWFDRFQKQMAESISENWIFWLSGLSLALGGFFLIRYGIEAGYFGPTARVIAALVFGLALIGIAERLRQRSGGVVAWFDLPPALAGAGIFSMFGAVIGAHILYDLIAEPTTFVGLMLISLIAVGGGILYGPMLSVLGILGAYCAPFLLKTGEASAFLLVYFTVVFFTALLIERYMRWIWLSALAGFCAVFAGWLAATAAGLSFEPHVYAVAISALAISVPAYGLVAFEQNHIRLDKLFSDLSYSYPTVFALFLTAGASLVAVGFEASSPLDHGLIMGGCLLLLAWMIFVMWRAEPLKWVTAVIVVYGFAALYFGDFDRIYDPEFGGRDGLGALDLMLGVGFATLVLCGSIWRAERTNRPRIWYILGSFVPILSYIWMVTRDQVWGGGEAFTSDTAWGLVGVGLAAVMAGTAYLVLQGRQRDRRPGADFFLASTLITLGVAAPLLIADPYLTHSYGILSLVAAVLIANLKLRITRNLVWFGLTVAVTCLIGVNYPPLDVLNRTQWDSGFEPFFMHITYLLAIAVFSYGWRVTEARGLHRELIQFETALLVGSGVYGLAWIDILLGDNGAQRYVIWASNGTLALLLAAAAFYRLNGAKHLVIFRYVLASLYLSVGVIGLLSALLRAPLFDESRMAGVFPFDANTLSFLFPAAIFLWMSRMASIRRIVSKWVALGPTLALLAFAMTSAIRWFWHGASISLERGFEQGELYTYTILMIGTVGLLLWITLARQSLYLKRVTLGLAALTAAKVFLVDMAGMTGLPRATIFMVLGAALGSVAWLLNDLREQPEERNV
ncbi:MAG: DUF2339 domain-containing protein [Pseudomonadota bacterium]